jgi:hypothetical protein
VLGGGRAPLLGALFTVGVFRHVLFLASSRLSSPFPFIFCSCFFSVLQSSGRHFFWLVSFFSFLPYQMIAAAVAAAAAAAAALSAPRAYDMFEPLIFKVC